MALIRTGGFILKSIKPALSSPFIIPPSSVNLQVRFAARKGYREKKRARTASRKSAAAVVEPENKLKRKFMKVEKTFDLKKPPPPDDDIFISGIFNYKKFTLSEAVLLHREYHHPEIYNNPSAPISLRIEINMTAQKSTQFLKPFKGIASIPHPFVVTHMREVLVLCNPEDVQLALSSGANMAGGTEMVKKIQEGVIQPTLFEYVIAHTNFLSKLTPIRSILKDQLPKPRVGTLTTDLKSAINRFRHGIEYSCVRTGSTEDFGFIDCHVGLLNMELNQLEENLKALIEDIEKHRPPRDGDFISWIWCTCKPSNEQFAIDVSKYVTTTREDDDFEDEEEAKVEKSRKSRLQRRIAEMEALAGLTES